MMGMYRENGDVKGSVYIGAVREIEKLRAKTEQAKRALIWALGTIDNGDCSYDIREYEDVRRIAGLEESTT
jgi:hypothetical protein